MNEMSKSKMSASTLAKDGQKRAMLVIASRLLSYPAADGQREKAITVQLIKEMLPAEEMSAAWKSIVDHLYNRSELALQKLYVSTFDLQENLGLYLTAHELKDSHKRGSALIQLQRMLQETGFQHEKQELADYLPTLFEWLAVLPEYNTDQQGEWYERTYKRVACVTQRILDHMPEDNPYQGIFSMLMRDCFERPTEEEMEKLEQEREETDLDPLPYPLLYQ